MANSIVNLFCGGLSINKKKEKDFQGKDKHASPIKTLEE